MVSLPKLARLSVAEARARLEEKLSTARERLRPCRDGVRFDPDRFRRNLRRLLPGANPGAIRALEQQHSDFVARIADRVRTRVDQIESNRLHLLWHPADLTPPVDWHRDPKVPSFRWPADRFYADIDYHAADVPDVKFVWELNRHQFFADLGADWLIRQRAASADRLRQYLLSWIDQNPPYHGVNWTSALEVAVRAISWLWSLAQTADWSGWTEGDLTRIAHCLTDHARYLVRHLSLYSSPYNHLMGEAAGLYWIGQGLRGLVPEAKRWRERAAWVFRRYANDQFGPDGFTVEQATGYHFFTLGFLVLVQQTAERLADGRLAELLRPVVHRAFRAGAAFAGPDGRWPAIGDIDLARSLPVIHPNLDEFWDFRSLCNLGAVLFEDPEIYFPEAGPSEEAYWLLGPKSVEAYRRLEARAVPVAKASPLRPIGLCSPVIWSRGDSTKPGRKARVGYAHYGGRFLLDCAPIAGGLFPDDTPSAAHGHLDLLQVLVWLDGKPVVVDTGMTSYRREHPLFRYQRSAAGHNTIEVVGCPWAEYAGGLAWRRAIQPDRLDLRYLFSEELGVATAEIRLPGGGRLRRTVASFASDGIWVVDELRTGPKLSTVDRPDRPSNRFQHLYSSRRERPKTPPARSTQRASTEFASRRPCDPRELRWYWHPAETVDSFDGDPSAVLAANRNAGSNRRNGNLISPSMMPRVLRARWGGVMCRVWMGGWDQVRTEHCLAKDDESDPAGWRSLGYGHQQPGSQISIAARPTSRHAVAVTWFGLNEPRAALRIGPYEFDLGLRVPAVERFGIHSPGEEMTWFLPDGAQWVVALAVGNIAACSERAVAVEGVGELTVLRWSVP